MSQVVDINIRRCSLDSPVDPISQDARVPVRAASNEGEGAALIAGEGAAPITDEYATITCNVQAIKPYLGLDEDFAVATIQMYGCTAVVPLRINVHIDRKFSQSPEWRSISEWTSTYTGVAHLEMAGAECAAPLEREWRTRGYGEIIGGSRGYVTSSTVKLACTHSVFS